MAMWEPDVAFAEPEASPSAASLSSRQNAFAVNDYGHVEEAVGVQYDSRRPTRPSYSLPRSTRAAANRLYVSAKHAKRGHSKSFADAAASPGPGAYSPKRQSKGPCVGFGTSPQRCGVGKECADSCSDLLRSTTDLSTVKRRPSSATMGKGRRDASFSAPDLQGSPLGGASPGPQRYKPNLGSSRSSPGYSIRPKASTAQDPRPSTPSKVGPGAYGRGVTAMGEQLSSQKPSSPGFSFGKQHSMTRSSLRDRRLHESRAASPAKPQASRPAGESRASSGQPRLARPTSAPPSYSFGRASRGCNVTRPSSPLDAGPAASMQPLRFGCPDLPVPREVIRWSSLT